MKRIVISGLVLVTILILLTSCQQNDNLKPFGFNISYSAAIDEGYVVLHHSGQFNVEQLATFYERYEKKIKANVTIVTYTVEGSPLYTNLDYNGKDITYIYDNSLDSFGGNDKGVKQASCEFFNKCEVSVEYSNGTQYYLTECDKILRRYDADSDEHFIAYIYK